MKEYRITYKIGEETEESRVIERSEAAARKDFKAHHKDGTILEVELVAEDVPATKDQEREALAKIKQMVEELGPQSYVGTAFEGCFRDAEGNIENDFGCSMKQKLESAEFDVKELKGKLAAAEQRLGELGRLVESLKEERRILEVELEKKTLPQWIHEGLVSTMSAASYYANEYMERAADKMANNAESPLCVAFKEAVEEYRRAKELRERCEKSLYGLDALELEH